jgi:hypothetical protein
MKPGAMQAAASSADSVASFRTQKGVYASLRSLMNVAEPYFWFQHETNEVVAILRAIFAQPNTRDGQQNMQEISVNIWKLRELLAASQTVCCPMLRWIVL